MGVETSQNGSFRLKDGLTLVDVVQLFDEDADQPPAPGDTQWTGDDYNNVLFQLEDGELSYQFGGESFSFAEQVRDFLNEAQTKLAAEAWMDYDTAHDGEDQIYGPDERSKLLFEIKSAAFDIQHAEGRIRAAADKLARL